MTIDFLLQEDGNKLTLEDSSGSLILERSVAVIAVGADIIVFFPSREDVRIFVADRGDVNIMISSNGDVEIFTYGSDDTKIYLNSEEDIEVIV